ncbi:hypothetical protein JOF56_006006 [Kibdelosporangium banguiense]|uniref:Uncharacterized protein n=1 Tax=Kibdelosporangium banguiense TaxID=1365924 RepID=A0ABS4TMH8_9PSEU|nr:DUF6461 domain-containing protein [Kibdelosporangium banguiense]MBP2325621.1 hypothetical protein [Kibdelosporangium banguiense]
MTPVAAACSPTSDVRGDPERRSGQDPSALDEHTADLYAVRQIWKSKEGPASANIRQAAAMALVEHATGVRLTAELLDSLSGEPWQWVMLSRTPRPLS